MTWEIKTAISVSALNVALNTFVCVLVYVAGVLAAIGVSNLLKLELKKRGRAPVFYESESRWDRLIDFVKNLKFLQSPTKFLIVFLSSVLLLLFEVSAESGVDSSNFCKPAPRKTNIGICANDFNGDNSTAKKIASALYAQQVGWNEEHLASSPILTGFRKNFDGREAFGSKNIDKSLPVIVRNCSVSSFKVIPPLRARLTFRNTISMWALRMTAVYMEASGETLLGEGDLTNNPKLYNAFLVTTPTGGLGKRISATFVDYADSSHLINVMVAVYRSGDVMAPMIVRNQGKLLLYKLSCERNALSAKNFQHAVQIYRSTQLQSSVKVLPAVSVSVGSENVTVPRPLSASDLVKATIAMKSTDIQDCTGETLVYTTCGVYNTLYLGPVLLVVLVLGSVVIITRYLMHKQEAHIAIPTTAKGWSKYVWNEIQNYGKEKKHEDHDRRTENEASPEVSFRNVEFFLASEQDESQVVGLRNT